MRSAIELLSAAYALHPAFGEAEILEMSAEVRPAYPGNEPRIEERACEGEVPKVLLRADGPVLRLQSKHAAEERQQ